MVQKKNLIIVGACIIVAGLGVGIVLVHANSDNGKTVESKVSTTSAAKASKGISVTSGSATNSLQQASGDNSSNTSGSATAKNDTQAEITKMTDPSTFGQYDAAKYKNGSQAYFADLQVGTGTELSKTGQKPVVVYRGWLTNGKLFDETKVNSKGQNEAFEFTFNASPEQVIPGWDEGLAGMKVGGIRLLIVPPAAGYGATAHPPIPANSVLIFEVQLAEIQ